MAIILKVALRLVVFMFSIWGFAKFESWRLNRLKKKVKEKSRDSIKEAFEAKGWRVVK